VPEQINERSLNFRRNKAVALKGKQNDRGMEEIPRELKKEMPSEAQEQSRNI
jgi:hypothetical protein